MYGTEYIDFLFSVHLDLGLACNLCTLVTAAPRENIFYSKLQDGLLGFAELEGYNNDRFLLLFNDNTISYFKIPYILLKYFVLFFN